MQKNSYVKGPNKSLVNDLLFGVAHQTGADLKILNENKSLFDYTAYFSVSGTEQQVSTFENSITQHVKRYQQQIENHALNCISDEKYNVDSVSIYQNSDDFIEIAVKVGRFSLIADLGYELKHALDLDLNIHKKNNFLKKEITFSAKGTKLELLKFKDIFLQLIESKQPVSYNEFSDLHITSKKRKHK